jgi:hypothetical protein
VEYFSLFHLSKKICKKVWLIMFFFLIKQIFSEWIIYLNEERWLVTQKNIDKIEDKNNKE